jgi:nucleoside-diphosphate-sugar epimerase
MLPLLAQHNKILLLSRKKINIPLQNVTVVEGDLLQPATLVGKFSSVTKVIHMAAITHSRDQKKYWDINFEGTQNLLNALPSTIDQFVYASTTSAAPNAGGYGESKLAVENLLKKQLKNYVILKIGDVYGGAGEKSLEQLFTKVTTSTVVPLIGDGHYPMAPVHVDDVITVMVKAVELSGTYTFVVTGSEQFSFKQLVQQVANIVGKKIFLLPIPEFLLHIIINVLATFAIGEYYPDQVQRFTVTKELDSQKTWQYFNHTPHLFSKWLQSFLITPQS